MLLRSFQKAKDQSANQRSARSERAAQLNQRISAQPTPALSESQPRYRIDYLLLYLVGTLTLIGLISILSASAHVAQSQIGDASHYFKRQMIGVILGSAALVFTMRINLYRLPRWIKPLMGAAIILLICTHLPGIGVTAKGSSRWIHIPGLTLQPSELAKPLLVLYLSAVLGHPLFQKLSAQAKAVTLFPIGAILFLVLRQPDLGTTIVIGTTALIMYFVAGTSYWKIGSVLGSGFVGAALLSWSTPYQQARITSWIDPWSDAQGKGFHLIQSMIAIGSGGLFGTGFGQSVQKLFYLPEQHTDFIFAVIAEEFGFLGICLLLLVFILMTQRGVSIACKSPTPYLKLLAIGLTSMISMQALVNMAVVSGTIPTTGLTLPFISFGSSSLIVNLASMGLLLNISRYIPDNHPQPIKKQAAQS